MSAFLPHLAREKNVAASTQNQALAAILFLYEQVLHQELPWLEDVVRAKRPARLPEVLMPDEVAAVLRLVDGINGLVARLLYGTGMRIMEALRLRERDLDFGYRQILVSMKHSCDPRDGEVRRHHLDGKNVHRVVHNAVRRAGIYKKASCHAFRHCFATHRMTHRLEAKRTGAIGDRSPRSSGADGNFSRLPAERGKAAQVVNIAGGSA